MIVTFQSAPSSPYIEPSIVDGHRLNLVDKIMYLGSTINTQCTLDDVITTRVKKIANTFAALNDRVWPHRGLKNCKKMTVYNARVLTYLLYSYETLGQVDIGTVVLSFHMVNNDTTYFIQIVTIF